MLERLGPYAANALTALRVGLTPVFVVLAARAQGHVVWGFLAVLVFASVAASDVWDGRVARRWGSASGRGRVFDHLADIGFILVALSTYAALGIAPWWVPAAIAGAFGFYVVNSWWRPRGVSPARLGSRIGHAGGVCNYVLIGVLVCNNSAGIGALSASVLQWLFALVPIYSGLAVLVGVAARQEWLGEGRLLADVDR
jgi:phosphatidylglycerophosphate synthase